MPKDRGVESPNSRRQVVSGRVIDRRDKQEVVNAQDQGDSRALSRDGIARLAATASGCARSHVSLSA